MNIEQTKEYQQLCECYNVGKVVYAYEADGEDRDGYPIQGETRTFKTYQEFKKSRCYNLCITDEEDFEYHKELPKFTPQKQLDILKFISKETYHISIFTRMTNSYYRIVAYGKIQGEGLDKTFEKALVLFLIELKDNLDHAKVKEILEG